MNEIWGYLGGFFERGAGEVSFLEELQKTLQQANQSGSQTARRSSGRSGSQTFKQPGKSGEPSKAIKPGEGSLGP